MRLVTLSLILLLQFSTHEAAAQQRPIFGSSSDWFSVDKPRHLALSAGLTVGSTSIARLAGADDLAALVAGAAVTGMIGAAKEWHDWRTGGYADPKDMVWNAVGIAAGTAFMRLALSSIAADPVSAPRPRPAPLPVVPPCNR